MINKRGISPIIVIAAGAVLVLGVVAVVYFSTRSTPSTTNTVTTNTTTNTTTNQSNTNRSFVANTSMTCTTTSDCTAACAAVSCLAGTMQYYECQDSTCLCACIETGVEDGDGAVLVELNNGPVSAECTIDDDCRFANKEYDYASCYPGYCDTIDYAQDAWVTVNADDFARMENALNKESCGAQPSCSAEIVSSDYRARCVEKVCRKVKE